MKSRRRILMVAFWAASAGPIALGQATTQPAAEKPATAESAFTPVSRTSEDWWQKRHEAINARVKQGDVDLIFIGDSITQGWEGAGKEEWAEHYANRKAANLGISGDRTQHVLWRLENGNIDGISPKLAVVMIGTNNSNADDHTAAEIADGIAAIVAKLRSKLPQTKILLLAIFPRGEKPNPPREKIAEVNRTIAKLADDRTVHYLDIGPKFLGADGTIAKDIMPDFLHLSPRGYEIWAGAIEGKVDALMKTP